MILRFTKTLPFKYLKAYAVSFRTAIVRFIRRSRGSSKRIDLTQFVNLPDVGIDTLAVITLPG